MLSGNAYADLSGTSGYKKYIKKAKKLGFRCVVAVNSPSNQYAHEPDVLREIEEFYESINHNKYSKAIA